MAYNNGFPINYQQMSPMYYPQPQQTPVQQPIAAQNQPQMPQGQNTGFVRVQSENEARMYPVAPGTSVVFINENEPYCYTKTVDMSQLDRPKFDRYRLVKEEAPEAEKPKEPKYATLSDLEKLKKEVKSLKSKITKEDVSDDEELLA